jgi:hypothetical protein
VNVQRVRFTDHITYLVLNDAYSPIEPILSYLRFLDRLGRSPNTIRAAAYHLKAFWEYLQEARLDWVQIDVAQLPSSRGCASVSPTFLPSSHRWRGEQTQPLTRCSAACMGSTTFTCA